MAKLDAFVGVVRLTQDQYKALHRLKAGLAHHDAFGAQSDDCAIMIDADTLFELPYDNGRLSLGDLRDLVSILDQ